MPEPLFRPAGPPDKDAPPAPLRHRLGWFVLIALASGAAVMVTAYILRGLLFL